MGEVVDQSELRLTYRADGIESTDTAASSECESRERLAYVAQSLPRLRFHAAISDSLRPHAHAAVESNDIAVEHRVVEDVQHERREFLGTAESSREDRLSL